MGPVISIMQSALNSHAPAMKITLLSSIFTALKVLAAQPFVSYRPDLYYMRGPGPKWHEKHGRSIQSLDVVHRN
jgi:hypothetical protein